LDFITEVYTAIADTIIAKESLIASGVLDYWVEQCIRFSDEENP